MKIDKRIAKNTMVILKMHPDMAFLVNTVTHDHITVNGKHASDTFSMSEILSWSNMRKNEWIQS